MSSAPCSSGSPLATQSRCVRHPGHRNTAHSSAARRLRLPRARGGPIHSERSGDDLRRCRRQHRVASRPGGRPDDGLLRVGCFVVASHPGQRAPRGRSRISGSRAFSGRGYAAEMVGIRVISGGPGGRALATLTAHAGCGRSWEHRAGERHCRWRRGRWHVHVRQDEVLQNEGAHLHDIVLSLEPLDQGHQDDRASGRQRDRATGRQDDRASRRQSVKTTERQDVRPATPARPRAASRSDRFPR